MMNDYLINLYLERKVPFLIKYYLPTITILAGLVIIFLKT